jgi:serine/threonine protein kinase
VIGTQLGNYRIIAPIGESSLGVVYLAEHQLLGSKVAIKRFHDAVAADRLLRRRVVTAARTAAKCRHPGLVTVFDLIDSDDHLALAMELLEGESLAAHHLAARDPATPAETWRLLSPVLDAVAWAHSQGVVHGALRPSNLMLAQLGGRIVAKVTDLCLGLDPLLSQVANEEDDSAAEEDVTPPKPALWLHYMAPEQNADPDVLTPAADIYALGVLIFETLAGTRPFHESTVDELTNAVRTRRAPGIRSVLPSLSPELEEVIARAIEIAPAARWPDCQSLTTALETAVAAPSPATAPMPTVSVQSVAPPAHPPVAPPVTGPLPYTAPAISPQPAPPPTRPPGATAAGPTGPRRFAHPSTHAGHPRLGRRTRTGALRNDPTLAAMEPASTARDKWIIAGTVGVCLIALLVAMIVALAGSERTSPSLPDALTNTNANDATTTAPPAQNSADAGAVATNVTCATLRGNWTGVFYAGRARLAHHFTGTVQGTPRDCRATFRITTNRRGYVIEQFGVTIVLGRITFRGTHVDASKSPYGYSKDTFVGHLNLARTRFSGRVRDSKGIVGTVRMQKK